MDIVKIAAENVQTDSPRQRGFYLRTFPLMRSSTTIRSRAGWINKIDVNQFDERSKYNERRQHVPGNGQVR